ncbi:MAG: hypothetical protein QOJ62_2611 [Actinomycetota bacterium]|nr:hypothetical protein [Actinomycetota bacterium]
MQITSRRRAFIVGAAALASAGLISSQSALASSSVHLTSVAANDKVVGYSAPNVLSPELTQILLAQGSNKLENPSGIVTNYGYVNDGPFLPALGTNTEAHKTEPDKNTYLVLSGQHVADPNYWYGAHFLFQGHETGPAGYITRINLDADAAHRVTLFASQDSSGVGLPTFDGSSFDPFSKTLLFTTESRSKVGVYEAGLNFDGSTASVHDLGGSLGRAAYEGVQADSAGNLWLAEDASGATVAGAKQPASYLYRFVPTNPADLTKGKLQALQILDTSGTPITTDPTTPLTPQIAQRYTYDNKLATRWVTVHDTSVDGTAVFDAFAGATTAKATPLKRPENGVFRPGSKFGEFYYTETGDTSATSTANPDVNPSGTNYGGYGGIFKVVQKNPSADTGYVQLVYTGDKFHAGFDNVSFLTRDQLLIVEDAGDTLHTQRAKLDSGYALDVTKDWSTGAAPTRFLGEGRDASATVDSALFGSAGFPNEGDNEITGIIVSDGNPTIKGLYGADVPKPFHDGWRVFWTQQHGDNNTFEIIPAAQGR